ncbi:methylated-DNA--[protein]-cysteine S-methyltransferase [Maribacter sp. 2307ULW6-5]|uniref:methylated-DNA--[protein]-cysteine S-methyltransferase n=1 Tax=Maribacter sp. 2307ULW6-5 TaxID=3386275 RepID=UPI0039BCBED8
METATAYLNTPLGTAKITGNDLGIQSISVLMKGEEEHTTTPVPEPLRDCAAQLQAYFKGKRQDFQLCLRPRGTPFQKKVWKALENIPYGETISYLDLAKHLGDAKAVRAVAAANGKNPLWIVVPCHRVIGSDGSLTGYAGGLQRKKWLLEHERGTEQLRLF